MTLPSFLVVGAMKAGTTSLWAYLRRHPDIWMPEEKELDFFVAEKRWGLGLGWYREQFDGADGAAAIGEASTNYAKHPLFAGVPERITATLPDVRIVYVVRHPIDRIVSHYRHAIGAGWEKRPIARAVAADPQYLDVSRYAMQLERYLDHVDRERVLVVFSDELRDPATRAAAFKRVTAFVGARPGIDVDLDDELHAAEERVAPKRGVAAVAEALPGRAIARRLAPPPLRRMWHRATALDHPDRVRLPDDVSRSLGEALAPDVARFRRLVDADDAARIDRWGLT